MASLCESISLSLFFRYSITTRGNRKNDIFRDEEDLKYIKNN
ncbi:hypothetical protein [Clostridium sp. D43t1_170807_H7]|nr:hypothetical protein [Clostridium sp. D43t1_170807_H7]